MGENYRDKPEYVPTFAETRDEAFSRGVDAGIDWILEEAQQRSSPSHFRTLIALERTHKKLAAITSELASSRENWHAEHRRGAECIERLELESLAMKRRIAELESSEAALLDALRLVTAKANEVPGLSATVDELRHEVAHLQRALREWSSLGR